MRNRLVVLALILTMMVTVLGGCGEKKPSINVYNWGDYIDGISP